MCVLADGDGWIREGQFDCGLILSCSPHTFNDRYLDSIQHCLLCPLLCCPPVSQMMNKEGEIIESSTGTVASMLDAVKAKVGL
jgi:hypothetical protein